MLEFKDNKKAKINSVYKPPEKLQQDRKKVYERISYMKMGRVTPTGGNLEDEWDKRERQYMSWRPDKNADDWQNIKTWSIVYM